MASPSAFGVVALTPTAFLDRSRSVYRDRVAVIDGERSFTYGEFADRCDRMAGVLAGAGIEPGDRVSVLTPNTELGLAATFGVPWSGAVLNALNTRLSAGELAYIVGHAESRVLLVDGELADLASDVAKLLAEPVRVIVDNGPGGEYESLLADAEPLRRQVSDELSLLSLNYTSGTTGRPKGVMYAHRGAYLQALAMATQAGMDSDTVFLWTLPMFHCNGWCFPWAVTAVGGTHVTLRRVDAAGVWDAVDRHGVTHFNAAPTVLSGLVAAAAASGRATIRADTGTGLRVSTGGAPPSPSLLRDLAALGLDVTHLYGLTETYGPAVICDWRTEWNQLGDDDRAKRKARQGVANVVSQPVRVVNDQGRDVPADGETMGEVLLRGNTVMLGYYRDDAATIGASLDGWFRTGDLGVLHPDGYLELRDRAKDVIISGGENIASIEVEQALASHPAVLECAVVAAPDEKWGEVPVAFVTLRPGTEVSEAELIDHVKHAIARFKAPKRIEFGELPKTATGKVKKFALRERASL